MTPTEAKHVLLRYRPGTADADDPDILTALALARRNPELQAWLDQHLAFQRALRARLRALPVPAHLKDAILAEHKIVRVPVWKRPPAWLAAAAAVVVLLLALAPRFLPARAPDRFADFRARMVRTALRQYSMDIETRDMQQVREFMAARGAPSDYTVPGGLQRLSLTGGGYLKWRNQPVAMVCFDRGDHQMLYLFVLDRAAVKDAPPQSPQVVEVNQLVTASWSEGNRTYVLAGPAEADFARKYL